MLEETTNTRIFAFIYQPSLRYKTANDNFRRAAKGHHYPAELHNLFTPNDTAQMCKSIYEAVRILFL